MVGGTFTRVACDCCHKKAEIAGSRGHLRMNLRSLGWSASNDLERIYCPTCAPMKRNVGRNGYKKTPLEQIANKNDVKRLTSFEGGNA